MFYTRLYLGNLGKEYVRLRTASDLLRSSAGSYNQAVQFSTSSPHFIGHSSQTMFRLPLIPSLVGGNGCRTRNPSMSSATVAFLLVWSSLEVSAVCLTGASSEQRAQWSAEMGSAQIRLAIEGPGERRPAAETPSPQGWSYQRHDFQI